MKKSEAIKKFGSQAKLAKALGISRQAVHKWPDEIPKMRMYQIIVTANIKNNGDIEK